MKVQQVVRAQAQMVQVTDLEVGDVYKRLVKRPYTDERYTLTVGVVTGVDANDEDAYITSVEVDPEGSGSSMVSSQVFGTESKDLRLFPAVAEDVQAVFGKARGAASAYLRHQQTMLQDAADQMDRLTELEQRLSAGELQPTKVRAIEAASA